MKNTKKAWFTVKYKIYLPISWQAIILTIINFVATYTLFSYIMVTQIHYRNIYMELIFFILIFFVIGQWFAIWKMKINSKKYILIAMTIICCLFFAWVYTDTFRDYTKLWNNKSTPINQTILNDLGRGYSYNGYCKVSWDTKYGRIYGLVINKAGCGIASDAPNYYYNYKGEKLADCGGMNPIQNATCGFLNDLELKQADFNSSSFIPYN